MYPVFIYTRFASSMHLLRSHKMTGNVFKQEKFTPHIKGFAQGIKHL